MTEGSSLTAVNAAMPAQPRYDQFRRVCMFSIACVQLILAGALCNGWPGMRSILIREGVYSHLCRLPTDSYAPYTITEMTRSNDTINSNNVTANSNNVTAMYEVPHEVHGDGPTQPNSDSRKDANAETQGDGKEESAKSEFPRSLGNENCMEQMHQLVKIYASSFAATRWGLLFGGIFLRFLRPKLSNGIAISATSFGLIALCRAARLAAHYPNHTEVRFYVLDTFVTILKQQFVNIPVVSTIAASVDLAVSFFSSAMNRLLGMSDLQAAFALIGFAGTCLYSSTLHCANLFPSRQKLTMSLLAASLGMSPMVFIFMEKLHHVKLLGLQDLVTCLVICQSVILVISVISMPWNYQLPLAKKTPSTKRSTTVGVSDASESRSVLAFLRSFFSMNFFALITSYSVAFLALNFYIATFQDRLEELGGDKSNSASWCSALLLVGPFLCPAFGIFMEIYDTPAAAVLANTVMIACCLLSSTPVIMLQPVATFFYSVGRSMVSTLQLAHYTQFFGARDLTVFYGVAAPVYGLATTQLAPRLRSFAYLTSLSVIYRCLAVSIIICFIPPYLTLRQRRKVATTPLNDHKKSN